MNGVGPNTGAGGFWDYLMGNAEEEVDTTSNEVTNGDTSEVVEHDPNCVDPSCGTHGTGLPTEDEDFSSTEVAHTTVCPPNCLHSIAVDTDQPQVSQSWVQFFTGGYCGNPTMGDFTSEAEEMGRESPLKRTGSNGTPYYEQVYVQGEGSDDPNG